MGGISGAITVFKELEGQGRWRVTLRYITALYHLISKVCLFHLNWGKAEL